MYIKATPNTAGGYGNPQSKPAKGLLYLPDELLNEYIECGGFVILTVEGDTVTAIEKNAEAFDAWQKEAENTPTEKPETSIYDELAAAYNEGVQEA